MHVQVVVKRFAPWKRFIHGFDGRADYFCHGSAYRVVKKIVEVQVTTLIGLLAANASILAASTAFR
ncbi:hypothetical protein, partial [Pseudomonas syringae]|uniref:hypothetical protein n=1 Tax=Pseudomonas syringae TaxID=317 RepID=UPI001F4481CD